MFEKKGFEDKKRKKMLKILYRKIYFVKALEARKLSSQEALNAGGKGKVIKIVI